MKSLKFYFATLLLLAGSAVTSSCSDSDSTKPSSAEEEVINNSHFDIWVGLGQSGMSKATLLVRSVNSLISDQELDYKGKGVDVSDKLFQESIIKGKYYYQVPKDKDRFGKYSIERDKVQTIAEFQFGKNKYRDRRYTHAWINDNTLLLMSSNGDDSKVQWTKVDTDNMKIMSEGFLENLQPLPEKHRYSTSGIAKYRKSDNKIIYFYTDKDYKKEFYVAFINPATMRVEKTITENRAEQIAATAYGELNQNKTFFDENENLYIACNSKLSTSPANVSTQQFGTLLRIKNGETNFDQSYAGYSIDENIQKGKIVTVDYLRNNKVLLYIQDPEFTKAKGWGSDYNCYYAILDIPSNKLTPLKLDFSEGTFSQRSFVLGNTAYIGINPEKSSPAIYAYDIKTESLKHTLTIKEGYMFSRIVPIGKK